MLNLINGIRYDIVEQNRYKVSIMLYTSSNLPVSQVSLDEWQLVHVSGADSIKFLQGQLTADVTMLTADNYLFSAHCDPKGKVWSNMLLFKRGEDIYYIQRKSVLEVQLKELKKYAIFAKVTIEVATELQMMGLAGNPESMQATELFHEFSDDKNCITLNNITYLKIDFPTPRFIAIGAPEAIAKLTLTDHDLEAESQQWLLLDMEANYPIIDQPVSNQYLPQAFNLQHFAALSFDKGCYCGQEMVARAQYRGINKRALYLLVGDGDQLPLIGDTLELQLEDNWRETGCVTAALKLADNTIWVQAILANDLVTDAVLRIKNNPTSQLKLA